MVQEKKVPQSAEKQQAEAMGKIGTLLERVLPRDVKEWTDEYVANMEPQYIDQVAANSESGEDEVAVLEISTATLSIIDAIPGFVDEEIPGARTKEGLPKYKRWRLMIYHKPETGHVYEVVTGVPREEYEAEMAKRPRGMMDGHSQAAGLMLRAGGDS